MLNFIKDIFRYKAKSMKEFIEVVKSKNCRAVLIEPGLRFIANCQYALYTLRFTTTDSRSRKIVYQQNLKERFGRDRGFGDACNAAIKLGLLGEQGAKDLQAKLPGVSVSLMMGDRPMNNIDYIKLHQVATDQNVAI